MQVRDLDLNGTGSPVFLQLPLQELQSDGQLLHFASIGHALLLQFLYILTSTRSLQVATSVFRLSSGERNASLQDLFRSA